MKLSFYQIIFCIELSFYEIVFLSRVCEVYLRLPSTGTSEFTVGEEDHRGHLNIEH